MTISTCVAINRTTSPYMAFCSHSSCGPSYHHQTSSSDDDSFELCKVSLCEFNVKFFSTVIMEMKEKQKSIKRFVSV